jgi:MFS family permease
MGLTKSNLWTKNFIIITLVNFLAALSFYLLMIVISEFAMSTFNSSPGEAGFSASIFIIGALIARLFTGKWIARTGYKKMLCMGVIASLIMTLTYFGVTSAATIVADIVPRERSGEGIGYYSLSQTLATAIGPFIGMFLSQHGNYSIIFAACAIVSGISLVMVPFLSLRNMEFTDEQMKEMRGLKLSHFVEFSVIPISTICLVIYLCYSSIVTFLSLYAKEIHLIDAASFFFIVYAVVVLISRPAVGRLFDLKGENSIMYPAILIFSTGMFLFSHSYHGYALLLAAALIGLGLGAIQSSTQAIAIKIASSHRLGLANSTYFMFSDIGMGIGPLLVGFLIPFIGYRGMYTVVAIIALACLLFYYLLHGKKAIRKY